MLSAVLAKTGVYSRFIFRRMYIDADARGAQWAQGDGLRVTPFGEFVRKIRLDETPPVLECGEG